MNPLLRELADYLLGHKASETVNAASLGARLLPYVFILDIEEDSEAGVRLRIRLIGSAIDRIFRRPLKGRTLEEFIHGSRGEDVIATFHRCALTREPLWMRQVVRIPKRVPRYVEGVAVYLEPRRLYGGLAMGDVADEFAQSSFESAAITRERLLA